MFVIEYICIISSWKEFYKRLPEMMLKKLQKIQQFYKKPIDQICKGILLQGLERIYLMHNQNAQLFGLNSAGFIFICSNRQGELGVQLFKKGPMKPYLYLVAIHELCHFILHRFKECELNQWDLQFELEQNKQKKITPLGFTIIDTLTSAFFQFPKYFQQKERYVDLFIKDYQEVNENVYRRLQQIKRQFMNLDQATTPIRMLLFDLKKYYFLYQNVIIPLKSIPLDQLDLLKEDWASITDYVEKLFEREQNGSKAKYEDSKAESADQQKIYRFFFSLLATFEAANTLFPQLANTSSKFKAQLQKIMPQRYFIQKNQVIDKIMNKICASSAFKGIRQKDYHCEYSAVTLPNSEEGFNMEAKLNNLIQTGKDIANRLQQISKYFYQWKKLIQRDLFQQFDQIKFRKLKYQNGNSFAFKCKKEIIREVFRLQKKEEAQILSNLCQIDYFIQIIGEFFKFYQINIMHRQFPIFFRYTNLKKCQAGKLFQKFLFPSLQNSIYEKDYGLLMEIDKRQNRNEIGKEPTGFQQRRSRVKVRRGAVNAGALDISDRICGTTRMRKNYQQAQLNGEKMERIEKLKDQIKKQAKQKQEEERQIQWSIHDYVRSRRHA